MRLAQYRIYGLVVSSEIALPGAMQSMEDAGDFDVIVRRGAVPEALEGATTEGPNWSIRGGTFLLCVPRVARFLMKDGEEIVVQTEPEGDAGDAAIFLLGSALGILLYQRRRIVLHASAVCVGGKAVLFCGPSGSGKSTTAAALNARGYALIADDMCCLDPDASDPPFILPDGRMSKLWNDATNYLQLTSRRGPSVRAGIDKHYVELDADPALRSLPLGPVYVLQEPAPPDVAGIRPVRLADAVAELGRNAFRAHIMRAMGLSENFFAATAAALQHSAVYCLTRPMTFDTMDDAISDLEDHWRELSLRVPA